MEETSPWAASPAAAATGSPVTPRTTREGGADPRYVGSARHAQVAPSSPLILVRHWQARLRVGGGGVRHPWLLSSERRKDSYDSISSRDFDFDEGGPPPPVQQGRVMGEVGSSSSGDSVDGFGDDGDDDETTFLPGQVLTAQDEDEVDAARSGPPVLINIKPIGLSATHSRSDTRPGSTQAGAVAAAS